MQRKKLATCVSLVVFFAFAILPALAAAKHVEILNAAGTATLGNGALLKAAAAKLFFKAEAPATTKIECEGELTGKVIANSPMTGSKVTISKANIWKIGGKTGEHCTTNVIGTTVGVTTERLPWCLKSIENEDRVTLDAGDCSVSEPLRFTLHLTIFGTASGTCVYEGEHAVSSVNLNTAPAVMTAIQATSTFKRQATCTTETAEKNLPLSGEMEGAFTVSREDVAENIQFST
jgi:hypothetical protein